MVVVKTCVFLLEIEPILPRNTTCYNYRLNQLPMRTGFMNICGNISALSTSFQWVHISLRTVFWGCHQSIRRYNEKHDHQKQMNVYNGLDKLFSLLYIAADIHRGSTVQCGSLCVHIHKNIFSSEFLSVMPYFSVFENLIDVHAYDPVSDVWRKPTIWDCQSYYTAILPLLPRVSPGALPSLWQQV